MAFPTTSILANFNGPDAGPPPSPDWTTGIDGSSGSFTATSNQAKATNGTLSSAYWNVGNFGPDVEVYVRIGTLKGPSRVHWRVQQEGTSGWDGYTLLAYTPTNELYIYRVDNGSQTQLGAAISQTISVADSFGVSMIGSTITIYYKVGAGSWTSLGTRTDSTYSGAGKIGMSTFDALYELDDFGGGTVVAANVVTPGAATLALSSFAPQLRQQLTPPSRSLTFSTFAPSVGQTVTPGSVSLSFSTFAPRLIQTLTPDSHAMTLASFAPQLQQQVTPGAQTVTITRFAPVLKELVTPQNAALSLQTFGPGLIHTLTPAGRTLAFSTFAPQLRELVTPNSRTLILTTFAPNLIGGAVIPAVLIKGPTNVSLLNGGQLTATVTSGQLSISITPGTTSVDVN